jgi:hypothetical protein
MSLISGSLITRSLISRSLVVRGLANNSPTPPEPQTEFLDAESNLFNTSELFAGAELWHLAPVPSGLLHSTELLTDTALIGDN